MKRFTARRRIVFVVGLLGLVMIDVVAVVSRAAPAGAATGDFVATVNFTQPCQSASRTGVGITYDGTYLWYTCEATSTFDLMRANPRTGVVDQRYNINSGLGDIAYDAVHNVIWAGPGARGADAGKIWRIPLNANHEYVGGAAVAFNVPPAATTALLDGIAYDATDNTLYFKPDNSSPIYHYTLTGSLLGTIPKPSVVPGFSCPKGISGLALGGSWIYEGRDGCNLVDAVDKTTNVVQTAFSTKIASDPNSRDEGLTCDPDTFAAQGKQVMWSKEGYSPMRAHAFEIPANSCGVGGMPAQQGPGIVKVCKIAGPGVALNQPFTFSAGGQTISVPAGPASQGGFCKPFPAGFALGNLSVQEAIPPLYQVVNPIQVAPSNRFVTSNAAAGSVTINVGDGVTEVTFTDRGPGYMEVCKETNPVDTPTQFTFTIHPPVGPDQTRTIPGGGACSGPLLLASGTVTVTEMVPPGWTMTNQCHTIPVGALLSCNPATHVATATVVGGDISTQTLLYFRNNCSSHNLCLPTSGKL